MALSKRTIFVGLYGLMTMAQMVTLTVLPLEAFRRLGDAQLVSALYVVVAIILLFGRLAVPWLGYRIGRRHVFALGVALLLLSTGLLATGTSAGLIAGLICSALAFSTLDIVISHYILDQMPRHELGRFETLRVFIAAGPCTLGPWLGVYMQQEFASWAPFAAAAAFGLMLLAGFLAAGLSDPPRSPLMERAPMNPLRYLPRFFVQPRLRLSWTLAAGRNAWWSMFQVYGPIFVVAAGLGEPLGGLLVSLGLGTLWLVPLWGWIGRRHGLRRLLFVGYAISAGLTAGAALLMGMPWPGIVCLVLAAAATSVIDGAGNSLFMRAVHPYERGEMAAVFGSYRDVAQLVPPAIFTALLATFELPAVFIAGGGMMLVMAALTRFIPRRF
ncbi:MAG: MFS transporter [Alphaproteobacteria bacterium]|nr:MFS transporter [Alphaproteobacteria bacterium]